MQPAVIIGIILVIVSFVLGAVLLYFAIRTWFTPTLPSDTLGSKQQTPNLTGPKGQGTDIKVQGDVGGGGLGTKPSASTGSETQKGQLSIGTRLMLLSGAISGIIGVLAMRLWGMQVLSHEKYVSKADQNLTRKISTRASRGRILDRNGNLLVGNRPSIAVSAVKDVAQDELTVRKLANLLGLPKAVVKRRILDDSEGSAAPHTIAVDVSESTVAYLSEHADSFPGVKIESRAVRTYPNGSLAAHILGYAGAISKEELEAAQERESAIKYTMGDIVGKAGIEAAYEDVLQGVRGEESVHVDAHGGIIGFADKVDSLAGSDIVTTIDIDLQKALEAALEEGIRESNRRGYRRAKNGAAVCMNPKTGEILAMTSRPTFDPTTFVGGIGSADWEQLTNEDSRYPLNNRAIAGQYPAASTIKALSSIAALEYGVATSSSSWYCSGWWTGYGEAWGKWCWLHSGHGGINLVQGIVESCDTVYYEIAKALNASDTPEALQETFRNWGLGARTGIDLPGEAHGRVPDAAWKESYFTQAAPEDRKWKPGDTANIVIGQGDILVTPLQMCAVYAGVANHGVINRPHLLKHVLGKDAETPVVIKEPEAYLTPSFHEDNLSLVHEGLLRVGARTMSSFSGKGALDVAGKTGTGEVNGKDDYGWFVGYGPTDNPEYVIAAVIEEGGSGSGGPAHAVRQTFGYIFGELGVDGKPAGSED